MKTYTEDEVRDMLRAKIPARGGLEFAAKLKVHFQHVNAFLHARRRPGPHILKHLGLERVVMYRPLRSDQKGAKL